MSAAPVPFTLEAATALLPVTEAAALAQLEAPDAADDEGEAEEREAAAVLAMHQALLAAGLGGRLVAGKGLGRVLGKLYTGEELPVPPGGRALDLAVDPLEGTSYRPPPGERGGGAVAVLAAVPAAGFLDPGPFFYMDKLVAPPAAAGRVDPAAPLPERLAALAPALGLAAERVHTERYEDATAAAASPPETQGFLLIGMVVMLPFILFYTAYSYWVFRGKLDPEKGYH